MSRVISNVAVFNVCCKRLSGHLSLNGIEQNAYTTLLSSENMKVFLSDKKLQMLLTYVMNNRSRMIVP